MAKLKLHSIHCTRTEDWTGPDETYIKVDGTVVWGPVSMNNGDTQSLLAVAPVSFNSAANISVWDQDVGGVIDPDDPLGSVAVADWPTNAGAKTASLSYRTAQYTLTYEVIP